MLKKKKKLIMVVLIAVLPIFVWIIGQKTFLSNKAYEEIKKDTAQEDAYVKNELIIKTKRELKYLDNDLSKKIEKSGVYFKDVQEKSLPKALVELGRKEKISQISKVFSTISDGKITSRLSPDTIAKMKEMDRVYKIKLSDAKSVEDLVVEIKSDPDVEYVEPNFIFKIDSLPNDPYFLDSYPDQVSNRDPNWNPPHDYQWNIKKTNSSLNYLTDTSSIIVAVVDTGVDIEHPDLGAIWINQNEIPNDGLDNDDNGYVDDINGFSYTGNHTDLSDENNHGTHVAGIISAKTSNNVGLAGITGNTPIMTVKVMNANGYGQSSDIAEGIVYASLNNARVINLSLGGSYSQVMKDALDLAVGLDVIPVVAAGNGNEYSPTGFPASYRRAITVSAVDENLNKLRYSNYGPNVDVAAPGGGEPCLYQTKPSYCSNILSLKSSQNNNSPELVVGQRYLRLSGTSMATPHVSGVIAYLLAKYPQFGLNDIDNYIRFNSINPTPATHTEGLGWGVINSEGTDYVSTSIINFEINYPADNSLVGNVFTVGGQISGDDFASFEVAYRFVGSQAWVSSGVSLVGNGLQPIDLLVYGSDDNRPNKIATISLPDEAQLGDYEIKTTYHLTNGRSISAIRRVHYLKKHDTDWLYRAGDSETVVLGDILISDINIDGLKEIVRYSKNDYWYRDECVTVYDSNYHVLWTKAGASNVVIGNIDGRSQTKEIVVQTSRAINVYDYQGNLISDMSIDLANTSLDFNLTTIDTNNNGIDELVFYTSGNLYNYEQNLNNVFTQRWKKYIGGSTTANESWPSVGDLDGDTLIETVVLGPNKTLLAIDHNGNIISSFTYISGHDIDSLLLVDLDNDQKDEIVFHIKWGDTKAIKLVDNTFTELWSVPISNNIQSLVAADLNNDSFPEIYHMVNNSLSEQIIDRHGQVIYSGESYIYWGNSNNHGVIIADKDNNNLPELFTSGYYSLDYRSYLNIRQYNFSTGTMDMNDGDWVSILPQYTNYDLHNNVTLSAGPIAIDDLDNNNKLDLVISGVGIIEYPIEGVAIHPFRHHNFQRTNSFNHHPTPIPPSQTFNLLTGWNWISLKTISDNTKVSYVLSGIDGKYDMVLSENGAYSTILPPVYNTLNNLEAGKMYLIHMTEPATLGLYGQTINEATPINLHTGWNWIGYYPNIVQPISQVLSSITGQYQRVLSEDEYYDPSNPDGSSLLFMTPDEGYMIYSNIDQQLVYSIGQTTPITNNKSSCQKTITEAYTNIYTEKIKTYPNGSVVKVKNANNQIVGCGLISNNRLTITRLFGEEVVNGITYPGLKQNETPKIEIYNPEDKLIGAEKVDFKFNADKSVHKISFVVPTPTVTRKPTATPTPKNNPPIIETKSLPVGIVGKKYSANVIAADRDGDRLKMKISNLPTGLKSENCKTSFGKMTCTITGIPQKVGPNKVLVEVWDDRGASTNKTFLLYIKSWLKKDINQQ